jgi:hypothetical protein
MSAATGTLPGLNVDGQLEPVCQHRTHHEAHLVFARIALHAGLNIEPVRAHPGGRLTLKISRLGTHQLVGESDVRD